MPRARYSTAASAEPANTLTELQDFGDNPGALGMWMLPPPADRAPLVVVLHGCTQTAAGFAGPAGWIELARRQGFALLCPEQGRANNPNRCFNWFEPADTARGSGEAASIAAAVATMIARHGIDPARVFVTGLSAGGAMTASLLAAYPDVFAGGAIVAGLPHGSSSGVPAALSAMAKPPVTTPARLAAAVRVASPYDGPWPRVSVWHGSGDRTVNAANGEAAAAQWAALHAPTTVTTTAIPGGRHRVWKNTAGIAVVEHYTLAGMAHGQPIAAGVDGAHAAPFVLDVDMPAPTQIAAFWGLGAPPKQRRAAASPPPAKAPPPPRAKPRAAAKPRPATFDIGATIEAALRAAGLRR